MDLEILPEPSDDEQRAIVEALRLENAEEGEPSPWRVCGLQPDEGAYATAPRRHSRGTTRA